MKKYVIITLILLITLFTSCMNQNHEEIAESVPVIREQVSLAVEIESSVSNEQPDADVVGKYTLPAINNFNEENGKFPVIKQSEDNADDFMGTKSPPFFQFSADLNNDGEYEYYGSGHYGSGVNGRYIAGYDPVSETLYEHYKMTPDIGFVIYEEQLYVIDSTRTYNAQGSNKSEIQIALPKLDDENKTFELIDVDESLQREILRSLGTTMNIDINKDGRTEYLTYFPNTQTFEVGYGNKIINTTPATDLSMSFNNNGFGKLAYTYQFVSSLGGETLLCVNAPFLVNDVEQDILGEVYTFYKFENDSWVEVEEISFTSTGYYDVYSLQDNERVLHIQPEMVNSNFRINGENVTEQKAISAFNKYSRIEDAYHIILDSYIGN